MTSSSAIPPHIQTAHQSSHGNICPIISTFINSDKDGTSVHSEGRGATERSTLRLQQGFITQNAADSSVTVWRSHLICLNFFKTSSQAALALGLSNH
ncbi:hypothetical protein Q8A67_014265 [Cirrhinus molitorella]|uniref:Uncharacterized protein n=1 Tax=Cirrhinus molitorella TaxID=172907 RepID=A0AA88PPC4_9TELE|nr:hypothetical protein Q8A67_014265 [Cirrhinus molitorella]